MKRLIYFLCWLLLPVLSKADTTTLQPAMVITSSVTITRDIYHLHANGNTEPVIWIAGNNIVVDLNQSMLQGSNDKNFPDEFSGIAIGIKKGSKNITIRNANMHGYRIAIMGEQVTGLLIENCDLSYNYRPRLFSDESKEDMADRINPGSNEHDEWMRYGAGIYLKNCKKALIRNNAVSNGQCGLLLTNNAQSEIYDNDFSFNSGAGIGLYKSSGNKIYHNRIDYVIRSYSHHKYRGSQNGTGIALYEQCSDNMIVYNSITHCGKGILLGPVETASQTITSGCNDNFMYGNDLSYAANSGIDMYASRNLVMKNTIHAARYGVSATACYELDITDNQFAHNEVAIVSVNGRDINIALNSSTSDTTGIRLLSEEKTGTASYRSRNYWIAANHFDRTQTVYDIANTDTVAFSGNAKFGQLVTLRLGDKAENIDSSLEDEPLDMDYQPDPKLSSLKYHELISSAVPKGKENIRITEWGPYNFQYPLLWLNNIDSAGLYHFDVLGVGDNWTTGSVEGFDIISTSGSSFPATLVAKPDSQKTGRVLQLKYTGTAFIDPFGKQQESGYRFAYREPALNKE